MVVARVSARAAEGWAAGWEVVVMEVVVMVEVMEVVERAEAKVVEVMAEETVAAG